MKDLTTEQKAKAYDNAKYIMKEYLESGNAGVIAENTIRKAFPELAESENEMIRKDIVTYLKSILSNKNYGYKFIESWISWLEKQGERKSDWSEDDTQYINDTLALLSFGCSIHSVGEVQEWLQSLSNRVQLKQEWSEEDDYNLQCCIAKVQNDIDNGRIGRNRELLTWLNSLKNRVQPKQEWNKDDEEMLSDIDSCIKNLPIFYETIKINGEEKTTKQFVYCARNWLKSLRTRSQWKPSEGQLECLEYAIEKAEKDWSPLTNNRIYLTLKALKEQLKKLKG